MSNSKTFGDENDNSSNYTHYANIIEGKIHVKAKSDTPGAVARQNKNDKTVYELIKPWVAGVIRDIEMDDSGGFGMQVLITLQNGGDRVVLQIPLESRYAYGFLMSVKNLKLDQTVRFVPWSKTTDGKTKQALYLYQDPFDKTGAVDWYYTKEDMHGLPDVIKTEKMKLGKPVVEYNNDARQEFLFNMLKTDILPKLSKKTESTDKEEVTSDLPF